MKTPIQQAIEKFEFIQDNQCKTISERIFFDGVIAILEVDFIKIEREAIEEAYSEGKSAGSGHEFDRTTSSEYYNQTFNS